MIRAAIVGLGWWGQTILKTLADSAVIKPVLGIDPLQAARANAAAVGVETASRFEDALEKPDIDALILCTPQQHHAGQIVAAAEAGRHVFCEKPLCPTGAAARLAVAGRKKARGHPGNRH